MSGVPTRACRRFVRRLADDQRLPVLAFTDGDPYGYCNIYRTLKVGSGQAAHINRFFCVPQARYLGVTPQDIKDYHLEDATHPLEEADIKRAKDALKNDPFIRHNKEWQKALEDMLKLGVRIEQQAFAKHGLNFVLETYLPETQVRQVPAVMPAVWVWRLGAPPSAQPLHHTFALTGTRGREGLNVRTDTEIRTALLCSYRPEVVMKEAAVRCHHPAVVGVNETHGDKTLCLMISQPRPSCA